MHPLISLISFMVFAAFVSLGQIASSVIGFFFLVVIWLVTRQLPAPKAWLMIKRLRIFFLSLFVMYLWFTPGQLVFPSLDSWSPTFEGLAQGAQRIMALIILVLGVESLLRLLDRAALLTGLYYLATPFKFFGVKRERFIVRVLLTLEAAEIRTKPKKSPLPSSFAFKIKKIDQYLSEIGRRLAERMRLAAEPPAEIEPLTFEIMPLPHWIQWLIPLMIGGTFLLLSI